MTTIQRAIAAGLVALLGLCVAAGLVLFGYLMVYDQRIYPGVSARTVELGGLTVEEATSMLRDRLHGAGAEAIDLRAGGGSWRLSWAEAGRTHDHAGTAAAAYEVARDGTWYERLVTPWRVRFEGQSVEVAIQAATESQVEAFLKKIASEVYVPPTDARLRIDAEGAYAESAVPGRALDVERNTAKVLQGLEDGAAEVDLVMVEVPPRIREPKPAYTMAKSLLAAPFRLVVNDPLTNYQAEFAAPPEQIGTWLEAVTAEDQIVLEIKEPSVHTWLVDVESQIGSERSLVLTETLTRTLTALEAGEHQAEAVVRHPTSPYVVEPGDTMFDIAYRHGFPQWRLEEANPDMEPDELLVGMELTIPSLDVLFPEPLVPGKRIEIDLPEQRLRAYEDDELAYDFTCSTGMTATPTIRGQFQVLFKEPNAYAQRWSLEMPYFMAIYYERPGFANGIHELPINGAGRRLWASVLGWPASYGCIILDVGDAETLYDWAPVGTLVRIKGVAPGTPVYRRPAEEEP